MRWRPKAWHLAAAAAMLVFALAAAYAWQRTPSRYFPAEEVDRGAFPLHDVGLVFPPGREGVDYFGTLRMDVYIDEKGHVDRIEVLEATVPATFRQSAVRAFMETPFEPAVRRGRAVKSVKKVEVRFKAPVRELDRLR